MRTERRTITLELPSYCRRVRGFEVAEDGVAPIDIVIKGDRARIKLEAIDSGRIFTLRAEGEQQ